MENNLAAKAAVLKASLSTRQDGVSALARELSMGPSRLVRLISELRDEGLLEMSPVRARRAGRPKLHLRVTPLGEDFLKAYQTLVSKALQSRPSDLRRATADAEYARRIVLRGVSPYDLFFELNRIARRA